MNPIIKRNSRLVIIIFLIGPLFLFADNKSKDKNKLNTINKQIEGIEQKLARLKSEKKSILNNIYEIELRYEKEKIETNKVKYQLRRTQEKINNQEMKKRKLKNEIEASKKKVKRILRTLYKIPGSLYLVLFISADRSDQIYKNFGLFKALVEYQSQEINKIKENIATLNEVKKDLQDQYDKLADLTRSREQRLRKISGLKRQKLNYIKNINGDRINSDKLLNELKNEAEKLEAVIKNKKFISRYTSLNLRNLKGKLIWPLRGKVISTFGRKRSTKFNTYVFNNGIEIQPSGSDKVRAVHEGDVVFSEYFKGYGKLIIVQHGKNFLTMYGHCDSFLKQKGDRVNKGEDIAIAGSTGSISGKSLYFEVRRELKAQNPLQWLQKR